MTNAKVFSYFGKIGIDRVSSGEAIGGFEPRAAMVKALKERTIEKTVSLKCMNCGATRYLHIGGHLEEGKEKLFVKNVIQYLLQ